MVLDAGASALYRLDADRRGGAYLEETRLPGGFSDLIASKLSFTTSNPHIGELFTAAAVLIVVLVPTLLPSVPFLTVAAMFLGLLEAVAHTAAIGVFKLDHFYSPGLVTAVLLMLPIALLRAR